MCRYYFLTWKFVDKLPKCSYGTWMQMSFWLFQRDYRLPFSPYLEVRAKQSQHSQALSTLSMMSYGYFSACFGFETYCRF